MEHKVFTELNSIDKVKAFNKIVCSFDADFDLVSDRYVIDAKSIMGIFSIDGSKKLTLIIYADGEMLADILKKLEPFVCE